ncbi:MAG: hypothetical protein ABSA75_11240 [Candidatus Bathyarchaeia archaeon]|jgi:hypothetical protein
MNGRNMVEIYWDEQTASRVFVVVCGLCTRVTINLIESILLTDGESITGQRFFTVKT